jgi:hypothetical protein
VGALRFGAGGDSTGASENSDASGSVTAESAGTSGAAGGTGGENGGWDRPLSADGGSAGLHEEDVDCGELHEGSAGSGGLQEEGGDSIRLQGGGPGLETGGNSSSGGPAR